jgi:hypothetical protein
VIICHQEGLELKDLYKVPVCADDVNLLEENINTMKYNTNSPSDQQRNWSRGKRGYYINLTKNLNHQQSHNIHLDL